MTGIHRAREQFGARLRELREAAGLNGKQLAATLAWPHSKVSKIELGRQRPTLDDVTAWARATNGADQVDDLLSDLNSLRVESASWQRHLRGGIGRRQQASVRLEASTTHLRAFEPAVIPGLLQTADYARAIMTRRAALHGPPYDIEGGVRIRMQRQQVLYEPGRQLRFLITEAALRYRPCGPATHRAQLDRLIAIAGLDTVELAVITFDTELPMTTSHGFWIFDDRLVLVETLSSELSLRDPGDIDLYTRHFENLWAVASSGERAATALSAIAQSQSPDVIPNSAGDHQKPPPDPRTAAVHGGHPAVEDQSRPGARRRRRP